jgi:hypothetical protein
MLLLEALAAYAALGLVVALVFVLFGLARVVPHTKVTAGARVLLIPGATLLWPLILGRWLKARPAP